MQCLCPNVFPESRHDVVIRQSRLLHKFRTLNKTTGILKRWGQGAKKGPRSHQALSAIVRTFAQSEMGEHRRLQSRAMTEFDLGFHRIASATARMKIIRGLRAQPRDLSKLLQLIQQKWWQWNGEKCYGKILNGKLQACWYTAYHMEYERKTGLRWLHKFLAWETTVILRRGRVSKGRSEVKGQKFGFRQVRLARCERLLEIQVQSSGKRFMLDKTYGNKWEDRAVIWIYKLLNTSQHKFLEGKLGKIQKGKNDGLIPRKI